MSDKAQAKCTPGPYHSDHDTDGDFAIYGVDEHLIAITNGDGDEDAANAKLLAASWEMGQALNRMLVTFAGNDGESCMECGEKQGTGEGCDTCYVIGEAIKALQKAGLL
jgi:hypothetical protein